jgi:hypothetical protein
VITASQASVGQASATAAAKRASTTAATQPVWPAKYEISAATERVFVVTATAPSVAHASQARSISGEFSAWMSTLSPTPRPRSRIPAAMLRVVSRSSA